MRRRTWFPILAASLVAVLVATSMTTGALGGIVQGGQTQHVQITTNDDLGVVAGLVTTRTTGPFGLDLGHTETPTTGWIALAAEHAPDLAEQPLTVTDEMPFTDPNGGDWLSREVTTGETTAWVVPIGQAREDPTLGSTYNVAAIVDWSEVPEGADLTAAYHETLDLEHPEGTR